jgi:hypothetical protein
MISTGSAFMTEPRRATGFDQGAERGSGPRASGHHIIGYVVYSQALKGAQYMNIVKELEEERKARLNPAHRLRCCSLRPL